MRALFACFLSTVKLVKVTLVAAVRGVRVQSFLVVTFTTFPAEVEEVVCTDPSGNLKPPEVDSTTPDTERDCAGVVVHTPTFDPTTEMTSEACFTDLFTR